MYQHFVTLCKPKELNFGVSFQVSKNMLELVSFNDGSEWKAVGDETTEHFVEAQLQPWIQAWKNGVHRSVAFNQEKVSEDLLGLATIGVGETLSYKEYAERVKKPKAWRYIGQVLSKNPLPLIIPCHRITRSNGTTGGFMGYSQHDIKDQLLKFEKNLMSRV